MIFIADKTEDLIVQVNDTTNNNHGNRKQVSKADIHAIKSCLRVVLLGLLLSISKAMPVTSMRLATTLSHISIQVVLSVLCFGLLHLLTHRLANIFAKKLVGANKYLTVIGFLSECVSIIFTILIVLNRAKFAVLYTLYVTIITFNALHWTEMMSSESTGRIYKVMSDSYTEAKQVDYTGVSKLVVSILMVLAISVVWVSIIQLFIVGIKLITNTIV